jgi:hypothetical protein
MYVAAADGDQPEQVHVELKQPGNVLVTPNEQIRLAIPFSVAS